MSNVDVTRDAPRTQLPPIDPNVKIPPAVAAAAARAENYYKKPDEQAQPDGKAPVVAGETAPILPAPVTSVAPVAPVAPAAPAAPVAAAPAAPAAPVDEATWEHKFKSQQGRITSQNQTIQSIQAQLTDMSNEVVTLSRELEQARRQQQGPAQQQRLVTDDERSTFGEEFVSVAQRAAQEVLSPEVAALRGEVSELRQQQHQNAIRNVYTSLDTALPNWRIINKTPQFVSWLGLRDPLSGAIRKVLLDSAFQAADAARVVAVFRGFVAEDAARRPADPALPLTPAPGNPAPVRQPAVTLLDLAAPGGASASPTPVAGGKPIYSRADIAKFYVDCRKGLYAGRDAERQALEHDIINVAPREGRVRN